MMRMSGPGHQRARVLEVARGDRIRRRVGQCADKTGRILGGVLREHRRAHDEQIVGVPRLADTCSRRSVFGSAPVIVPPVLCVD